jgi:hypothetical protein
MSKQKIKRALLFATGGGLLGFLASYVYIQMGST